MPKEAVILAGGESWRLKPHTWLPKPLVELVEGITLLEWQVLWLKKHGFDSIHVCSRGFRIEGLDVYWVQEEEPLGTGGALKRALQQCREDIVYVLNVDDIILYDPTPVLNITAGYARIVLAKPRLPWGLPVLRNNMVIGFVEKPKADFYVSTGHYAFDREKVESLLPWKGDLERETLPVLASNGLLYAYFTDATWIPINTYKDLLEARRLLQDTTR